MELKADYKKTEVGLIPEDWEVSTLESITDPKRAISYGIVQTGPNIQNGIRCLRVVDIEDGKIKSDDMITTTKTISDSYKRTILKAEDLVMPLRGKVGDIAIVKDDLAGSNLTRGVALVAIRSDWSARYCRQYISSSSTRNRLEQSMNGSALQEIPIAALRSFKIALPPTKAEQEAIAEALSDTDALIESLEQLITKKRHLKQGAMQELLRPKKGWLSKRLGSLASLINGRAYSITEWETVGTPVIRLQNLTGRGETYYYSNLNLSEKQYCHSGDLLFMWSATFGPIIWQGPKAIFHYHIWKIECHPKQLDKQYLYHLLSDITEKLKSNSTSGGTMLHLTKSGMEKMEIPVPDYDEQERIATILSDMDAEITSLETKLAKTRQLKQGMMHNLLTGRIRLI